MNTFNNIKLQFGIHKGKEIQHVPNDYLKFLLNKGILKGKLLFHCQVRFNLPKTRYKITIEDAITGNGSYIIEAYNKQHAENICKQENNIQYSQSGTSIQIIQL